MLLSARLKISYDYYMHVGMQMPLYMTYRNANVSVFV